MIQLRSEFGFNSDGECAIQFQDYSQTRLISMVMVDFQSTSLHFDYGYVIVKEYGVDRNTVRFSSYPDVKGKAKLIFIIVVWHR
ncbi:putative Ubiquitin Carboxyl-Terminal Hydrolase Faf-X [Manis pentadactyla]|nr:putative Ubiquitin Carboxyl-Terminal Hydrolase Faf-X [Manis pentadactyla]